MVHHSKARVRALEHFIHEHVVDAKYYYEVSAVKQDGTVFIKFRSAPSGTYGAAATDMGFRFAKACIAEGMLFQQVEGHKFRMALDQFTVKFVDELE